ncbi:NAD-dependent formate dehydrogenase flavoprotein subunit [Tibeticola sediminis]|uniref:NAD-dependent formate dehydrogenase flavoprotein subunit n=2 Tax=Tibeticola sediminis TaxID=1917811 RepID=A0A3N4UQP2_9BURK|nr:NADH-ubiquinone oxidoreductase-F iron-sulfur binding region domain-containing protein [Tibeticola sediminis]RPE72972.1 NAD-dependent formate dehydrogenase flavoprotein subunit [Tibeticola sediminis]
MPFPSAPPDPSAGPRRPRLLPKGRPVDAAARAEVGALLGEAPPDGWARDRLIEYLHRLTDAFGALFERHLLALAEAMRLAPAEVYEVASFYHHFDILPDGATAPQATVRVCTSLSCAMAGASGLIERLRAQLGAGIRVVAAPCIGRCDQAPAALVQARGAACSVAPADARAIEAALQAVQQPDFEQKTQNPGVNRTLAALKFDEYQAYRAAGGYALAAALVNGEEDAERVLAEVEAAGLRGLGGAGFPVVRKWRIVRAQPAPRCFAVNIDEGEPGTFKDRHFLLADPHRFLEGVLIAAQVVGTERVVLYLRDEYPELRARLQTALAALEADPPCPLPEIELRRGAGAYICGEESAMLESIEGKRGEPRLRPPYIAEVGLFGRPTLEHNAETVFWLRELIERGGAAFAAGGRHGSQGWRSYSVSGRVRLPGVKRAPAGITLRELIDEYCGGMAEGHTLYAFLPGGASGGIFPASLADVPLDFGRFEPHGGFIGSAAVVVLSQHDRARDAALNAMRFFAAESCGQCTPCRVGTAKAAALMAAPVWDAATLQDLALVMADASICGLGQAAPNPLRCVLRYFPHEVGLAAEPPPEAFP